MQHLQVLDEKARIFLIPEFVSEAEADHLAQLAEPNLQRSGVVKTAEGGAAAAALHSIRTSSGAFLERGQDAVVRDIEQRIALWSMMPVDNGESMHVMRYNDGEKYDAHFDWFFDNSSIANGGNRHATVLLYLSDVEEGGETVFPMIPSEADASAEVSECAQGKLAVKPRKGSALLFHSQDATGALERRSLHASCPVLRGTKWAASKWIRTGRYMTKSELLGMVQQLQRMQAVLSTAGRIKQ
ncbi:hypothetical protein OEZ86_014096 [Tetradesmus obliquus]|nr:hypothetical protein OEZ86_014096 [Tetradesmus obliquus]